MSKVSATVTMEMTDDAAETIREGFHLEIEMMEGDQEKLPDGRTRYTFSVADPDKCELIKEFALKLISNSHKANLN